MKPPVALLSALVIVLALGLGAARAANWTATSNGNWHDAGNWSGGVPNLTGAAADFTADIGADLTITLNNPATVGNMTIADGISPYFSYIISHATNTLTFDDSDTTAGLTVSRGTANVISAPVALTDKLSVQLSNASRIEFSGQLSGAGQLEVGPSGTESPPNTYVRLSANNSGYAAGIRLLGGANAQSPRLQIANANALGSGAITGVNYYGGWLENVTGSTLTLNNNISGTAMSFAGNDFILNGTINLTGGSTCSIRANVTVANGFASDVTLDAGTLTGNTLKLLSSSVGDITSVSSGGGSGNLRLELWNDGALGTDYTQSVAGGALTLVAANGPRTIAKNFTAGWFVDGAGTLTLSGNTSGYWMIKNGTGLLTLSGTNSLSGYTTINDGVLRVASATALPSAYIFLGSTAGNGILELANGDFSRPLATSGAGKIGWSNSSNGGFSAFGGDRSVSLSLGGVPGAQLVWANDGFVSINNSLILNSIYANAKIDFQNPIDLTGGSQGAGNRRVLVNDNPNTTADYAVMSGALSGTHTAAGLIKQGDGKLVLTAPNTYIGQTQVTAGTLLVNGSHTGGAAYTVSPGATLGGTGTIGIGANTATWQAGSGLDEANRGGRVSPGASIGTLTLNGNASLQNYAVYVADLNATTLQSDLLQVSGNLTLGANLIVKLGDWIGDPMGKTFAPFLSYGGTLTGTPTWIVDTAGTGWTGGSVTQSGKTFYLSGLVPEPSALALLALGGALVLRRRR